MEIIFIILCSLIGSVVTWVIFSCKTTYGTLRIDHSNPEKDVYRFDVEDIDNLSKKKRIVLKVDNDADLSQN